MRYRAHSILAWMFGSFPGTGCQVFFALFALLSSVSAIVRADDVVADDPQANRSLADAKAVEFFETKIRPVLVEHCHECHAAEGGELQGGLSVQFRQTLLAGGDSGPAVVPGDPEQSLLMMALRYEGQEMPPSGRLPEAIVDDFAEWIRMGAYAPEPLEAEGEAPERFAPREVDLDEGRQFWAFQPLKKSPLPEVARQNWPTTWIDHYLLQGLEQAGLSPSPDVHRAQLLRRLTFDLTGLPPTLEQQEAFLTDLRPDALQRLVDRLLASPRFGEHWGRHWLDVARYADSNGNDFNATFHDAWRYRNYVVESFNHDKPFDQFVREQLAGDLLPYESDEQRAEQLVATGLLMVGTKMLSERDKLKMRHDVVDEQVDTVGRVFMGLTMGCARCHDHKFDPIPTSDYYAMAGIFWSTTSFEGESQRYVSTWVPQPLPLSEEHARQLAEFDLAQQRLTEQQAEWKRELEQVLKQLEKESESELEPKVAEAAAGEENLAMDPEAEFSAEASGARRLAEARRKELEDQLAQWETDWKKLLAAAPPRAPTALAPREADDIGDLQICVRGEPRNLGPEVPRGFLQVLTESEPAEFAETSRVSTPVSIPPDESGRRELAEWISSPRHPLTSRVMVNRIWQKLMGEGLVRTLDNFGALGESPTHPELLDQLAREFIEEGWSVKHLVRQIVLSRAYQADSAVTPLAAEVDPENRLWSRAFRRRLMAESIRDSMLVLAGDLDLTIGDRPVEHLGTLVTQNRPDAEVATQEESLQRSVYQPVIRGQLDPMLTLFDFADPDFVVGKRPVTTTPAQALFLMNSPFVTRQADRIVTHVLAEIELGTGSGKGDSGVGEQEAEPVAEREAEQEAEQEAWPDTLSRFYRHLYGRAPTEGEVQEVRAYWESFPRVASEVSSPNDSVESSEPPACLEPTAAMWRELIQAMLAATEFRLLD